MMRKNWRSGRGARPSGRTGNCPGTRIRPRRSARRRDRARSRLMRHGGPHGGHWPPRCRRRAGNERRPATPTYPGRMTANKPRPPLRRQRTRRHDTSRRPAPPNRGAARAEARPRPADRRRHDLADMVAQRDADQAAARTATAPRRPRNRTADVREIAATEEPPMSTRTRPVSAHPRGPRPRSPGRNALSPKWTTVTPPTSSTSTRNRPRNWPTGTLTTRPPKSTGHGAHDVPVLDRAGVARSLLQRLGFAPSRRRRRGRWQVESPGAARPDHRRWPSHMESVRRRYPSARRGWQEVSWLDLFGLLSVSAEAGRGGLQRPRFGTSRDPCRSGGLDW